jgi:hypothetical protein
MRQTEGDAGASRTTWTESKSPKTAQRASSANGREEDAQTRRTAAPSRGCGFCCFKFKEKTQINALAVKIANREKKFGMFSRVGF